MALQQVARFVIYLFVRLPHELKHFLLGRKPWLLFDLSLLIFFLFYFNFLHLGTNLSS